MYQMCFYTNYREHSELRIMAKSRHVQENETNDNGLLLSWERRSHCQNNFGNAVPTAKITLGTPFPGVPAGNDPCEKWIKKQTYMVTETCKLYFRVFGIFLPNFIKTDPYNFELYRFKVGAFFETQCMSHL